MNINNIQSYNSNSLQLDFFFQEIRQWKLSDKTDSNEVTAAMLHEFQLSIRIKTADNLIQQSTNGSRGDFFSPDASRLVPWEDSGIEIDQSDAAALFGENGFFSVAKTAGRIADFVLSGAGDDLEKLRVGREGVLRGFKEAEKIWGGTLPDISYETIGKALEAIEQRIEELGGSIVSYHV
jgi:hypothetical protein